MTENEKLRSLLAEARAYIKKVAPCHDVFPCGHYHCALLNGVDAALAEPMVGCVRCARTEEVAKKFAALSEGWLDEARRECDAAREEGEHLLRERDEARAEVERLRGITPELPPRPDEGSGLPRYGLRWNGPTEPVAVPLRDGYWTPWHLADAEARRAEIERQHTSRALDDAIALQRAACETAYQRGAEAMREAAALVIDDTSKLWLRGDLAKALRALPIPEDKP